MPTFVKYRGLSYNDISLVSSLGTVKSRSEIPIEGWRIVVAGMSSIIGEEFLKAWAQLPKELRCSIHIPRDSNSIKYLKLIADWKLQDWIFVGIGLNTPEIEDFAINNGYNQILIDIAHGGIPQLENKLVQLRAKFGEEIKIVTGSIMTEEQAAYLDKIGVNGFRTGVAVGDVCASRYQSGHCIGTVSELINLYNYLEGDSEHFIFADGGFKYPACFVKAFGLGAQYCMSGSVFTKCKEAQMHIDGTGEYFGMSSCEKGIRKGITKYDESLTKKKVANKTLQELLEKIWGGIRSGISYSGYSSLQSFIGNGEFCILNKPFPDVEW